VLLLPTGIAYLRKSSGSEAYAIGYSFGTAVAIVVLAAVAVKLHARFSTREREIPLAGAVALVAVLAIGAQFVLRGSERNDAIEDFTELADQCTASGTEPFGAPSAGTTLVDLGAVERAAFVAGVETALPQGVSAERYVVKRIVEDGRTLGAAVAYPGVGSEQDALAGFKEGVAGDVLARGGSVSERSVAGAPSTVAQARGLGIVAAANGCWGVAVVGPSSAVAQTMGESLLAP
jgi:hypothetical protein